MKTYQIMCRRCRQITPHTVYFVSRRKGVKLRCLKCGYVKPRYSNAQRIEMKGGSNEKDNIQK